MLQLNQSIQVTIDGVNRYIRSWQRHQPLWKTDKSSVMDKFKAQEPSCATFEEKLMKYSKVSEEFMAQEPSCSCTIVLASTSLVSLSHVSGFEAHMCLASAVLCTPSQMAANIATLPNDYDQDFIRVSCSAFTSNPPETEPHTPISAAHSHRWLLTLPRCPMTTTKTSSACPALPSSVV